MAVDIQRVSDLRVNEEFMVGLRAHRTHNYSAWKSRIDTVDKLYRGEWNTVFPDETSEQELPHVMNLVQVTLDDVARLVSEALPSVTCYATGDEERDQKNAYIREAIAETYWGVNNGEILTPKLAQDLLGTGACFLVVDTTDKDYPCIHRIDPRMAFPDTHNGQLFDLLVNQSMKVRVAAHLFPRLELMRYDNPEICDSVEVLEYYSKKECVQAVLLTKGGMPIPGGYIEVKRWDPEGVLPVAFAQLDSFDGDFRGMFDQITGSLATKNRLIKLTLDYTDQLVYAPVVSKGLLNPEVKYGPSAHYRLDPNIMDAQMGRLSPAGSSPQLFQVLEYLDREQRSGVAYPAQRQGEVSQSIASASFVASTQGQLTSTVRNCQRLLGSVRKQLNAICFALDERFMDHPKPLLRPVGKKKEYSPSRDIKGQTDSIVSYGAGAGLDRMNADVRVLQHLGAGLISRETAREQIDYLAQDGEEADRINREMAESALTQKFLSEAPWDVIVQVWDEMAKGTSMAEAIATVQKASQAEAAAAQAGGPPGTPGPVPEDPSAAEAQLALQKGGGQAGAPSQPKLQGPPITSILVRPTQ